MAKARLGWREHVATSVSLVTEYDHSVSAAFPLENVLLDDPTKPARIYGQGDFDFGNVCRIRFELPGQLPVGVVAIAGHRVVEGDSDYASSIFDGGYVEAFDFEMNPVWTSSVYAREEDPASVPWAREWVAAPAAANVSAFYVDVVLAGSFRAMARDIGRVFIAEAIDLDDQLVRGYSLKFRDFGKVDRNPTLQGYPLELGGSVREFSFTLDQLSTLEAYGENDSTPPRVFGLMDGLRTVGGVRPVALKLRDTFDDSILEGGGMLGRFVPSPALTRAGANTTDAGYRSNAFTLRGIMP